MNEHNQDTCRVINAGKENDDSNDDDYSVLIARTIYDEIGLDIKNISNIRLGWLQITEDKTNILRNSVFFFT